MKDARLELRIDRKLLGRVDVARGDVSRTRWVERALESALGGVEESKPEPLDHSVSAPSRAPVVESDAFAAGEVMDPPERSPKFFPGVSSARDVMLERQQRLNKRGKK